MSNKQRLAQSVLDALPQERIDVLTWAEQNVPIIGSARSEVFDRDTTPWNNEVLQAATSGENSIVTYVKPVQTGGSVVGEIALLYFLCFVARATVQYNWENQVKADHRWTNRFEPILMACRAMRAKLEMVKRDRDRYKVGYVKFPGCSLKMQGIHADANIDSESVHIQVNEEIHNWEPGKLSTADGRLTAFWDKFQLNISNAGREQDQLHKRFLSGTQQRWTVLCPGCGKYHAQQFRFDKKRPELGGLRWDKEKAKLPDGRYNYESIKSTVRYQMPCGYLVGPDPRERRKLNLNGRYSPPRNLGALLTNRSYTLDSVSIDYIDWVDTIQEYHQAMEALKAGDEKPFQVWLNRRPCEFYSVDSRPSLREILTVQGSKKGNEGLPNRVARFAAGDYQGGEAGELPHWWLVIRDVDERGNSMLVFEGKIISADNRERFGADKQFAEILKQYDVRPWHVVLDSGHAFQHVTEFAYAHGYNVVKGGKFEWYRHSDGSEHVFEEERFLADVVGVPRKYEYGNIAEPTFFQYSKHGIRELYHTLKESKLAKHEVPEDISDTYKLHMQSEERRIQPSGITKELRVVWVQVRSRNDLFVCECYVAMLMDMAGFVGQGLIETLSELDQKAKV